MRLDERFAEAFRACFPNAAMCLICSHTCFEFRSHRLEGDIIGLERTCLECGNIQAFSPRITLECLRSQRNAEPARQDAP